MSEVEDYLKIWCNGKTPSETGRRVARLLEDWQGLHHMDHDRMCKADWTHDLFVEIKHIGDLSTFDAGTLTSLVFLAHDHSIRVQITASSSRYISIYFHPRHQREGSLARRHPTLGRALESYRANHPHEDMPDTSTTK